MNTFDEPNIEDEDYVIVLDKNGKLKAIVVPSLDIEEMVETVPENVMKIIELVSGREFAGKDRMYH